MVCGSVSVWETLWKIQGRWGYLMTDDLILSLAKLRLQIKAHGDQVLKRLFNVESLDELRGIIRKIAETQQMLDTIDATNQYLAKCQRRRLKWLSTGHHSRILDCGCIFNHEPPYHALCIAPCREHQGLPLGRLLRIMTDRDERMTNVEVKSLMKRLGRPKWKYSHGQARKSETRIKKGRWFEWRLKNNKNRCEIY